MDPITLLLLGGAFGANVLSGVFSGVNQQQYQQAQQDANLQAYLFSMRERKKQQAINETHQQEAEQLYNVSKDATSREAIDTGRAEADKAFMDYYGSREGSTEELQDGVYLSGQDQATDTVKQVIQAKAAAGAADARSRVKALSQLGSFDAALNQSGLTQQNQGQLLNTLGGIRRGSNAVSQQMQAAPAAQVFKGNNLLSPTLDAAAMLMGGLAGRGGGNNGAWTPTTGGPLATANVPLSPISYSPYLLSGNLSTSVPPSLFSGGSF